MCHELRAAGLERNKKNICSDSSRHYSLWCVCLYYVPVVEIGISFVDRTNSCAKISWFVWCAKINVCYGIRFEYAQVSTVQVTTTILWTHATYGFTTLVYLIKSRISILCTFIVTHYTKIWWLLSQSNVTNGGHSPYNLSIGHGQLAWFIRFIWNRLSSCYNLAFYTSSKQKRNNNSKW